VNHPAHRTGYSAGGFHKAEQAFYSGKFIALRYFFGYELPKTRGLAERLLNGDGLTVEMTTELFND